MRLLVFGSMGYGTVDPVTKCTSTVKRETFSLVFMIVNFPKIFVL